MLFKDIVQAYLLHIWLPMAMPFYKVAVGQKSLACMYEIALFVYLFINKFKELGIIRRINNLKETSPYLIDAYCKKNIISKKGLVQVSRISLRQYSTFIDLGSKKINREDFLEWFRGFTDAEGCFFIGINKDKYFRFVFKITLHFDDYNVLEYIQKSLGIGKIYIYKNEATFTVSAQEEIKIIIDFFSKNHLNSTKHLNFLSFKKAFELYTGLDNSRLSSLDKSSLDLKKEIELIKSSMNSKRSEIKLPESHQIRITNYWLLGFVEGDGSFTLVRNTMYKLRFDISQSSKDLLLMMEIKNSLKKLIVELQFSENYKENLSMQKSTKGSSFGMINLTIKNQEYIAKVIIPFFDSMVWLSKKELDYKDWKVALKLRDLGLHYTKDGLKVLGQIYNQINNNRLSSNKIHSNTDSLLLQKDIDRLLTLPSNFEVGEGGKVWIKSLNRYQSSAIKIKLALIDEKGLTLNSFNSVSSCSDFLGISRKTIMKRLNENKAVEFNNKLIYIKKIESDD